ncbi:hypothetical protein [Arenibacter certesii]|uniref:Uncharacterized protein n=1 Tax=Arenibacter certesii TaxID=228955 RepID=A0A918IYL3_9FLAO|nr:hypothetical protein [Arenibacter certesii]GGW37055.1 hypothetical protein GCM10007383_22390 [Arenibacter certesii]
MLRDGTTEVGTIGIEGVEFGAVNVILEERELVITRGVIVNSERSWLVHAAYEQWAIAAAR